MYTNIKNIIYDRLLKAKDQNPVILWSGGPFSSLVWWIALKELNLNYPLIFVDTGDLPPALYAHIASMKQKFNLDLQIIQGKVEDVIKDGKYGVYLTGKELEGTTTVIPEGQESWNYLKSFPLKFFGGVNKLLK